MELINKLVRSAIGNAARRQDPADLLFNEAVNFDKQCIFIAVPKTGTTSIRSQLRKKGNRLIRNPHLNINQVRDSLYVYFLMQTLGRNRDYPTVSVPTDADIRLRAENVFTSFFKFAGVRNPWSRAVSLYSRREGVMTKDKMSFEEFCRGHVYASDTCCQPTLHYNQLDWLCNESGECQMDYVYKLEEFDKAIGEISEMTCGRIQLVGKHSNSNPMSSSLRYRELYTQETKDLIAKRFERDIDYFKYTF